MWFFNFISFLRESIEDHNSNMTLFWMSNVGVYIARLGHSLCKDPMIALELVYNKI